MPKAGHITGSRFSDMMTEGRGSKKWGVTSKKLAIRIAAERLGLLGIDDDGYTSQSMQWGKEQEPVAIANYERREFTEVHSQQAFQQHPEFEYVGCTPDGLIGSDGLLEVKNPDSENHLLHILNGKQIKEYKDQVQGSLWVTGREYCDFVSHDSRIKDKKYQLHITKIPRDNEYIEKMEKRYKEFEKRVQGEMEKLKQYEVTL